MGDIMSIYLHKILPLMISPLAIIMMLIIIAAVMRRRLPCIVALIILYVTSAPIIAQPFFRWVEGGQLRANAQTIPPADAVVVLSGMVGTVAGTLGPIPGMGRFCLIVYLAGSRFTGLARPRGSFLPPGYCRGKAHQNPKDRSYAIKQLQWVYRHGTFW